MTKLLKKIFGNISRVRKNGARPDAKSLDDRNLTFEELLSEHPELDEKKIKILKECLTELPEKILKAIKGHEVIGLCERITYHKFMKKDREPFTHILENHAICIKHPDYPVVLIIGPEIEYKSGFLYN